MNITSPKYFREQSKDKTVPFNKSSTKIKTDGAEDKQLTIKLLA